jgi:predicted nucleic acid-binding protein
VLRVFVDANVLIAGADSRSGASGAVLLLAEVGLFKLVVSRQVLDEAERNLRAKLPRALPTFAELLAVIQLEIVPDPEFSAWQRWQGLIEEKDAPILEAAVAAKVNRLLTLNTRDFTPEVAAKSELHIQTPAQFIHDLRSIISESL